MFSSSARWTIKQVIKSKKLGGNTFPSRHNEYVVAFFYSLSIVINLGTYQFEHLAYAHDGNPSFPYIVAIFVEIRHGSHGTS
jgi:hypothetical protein